MFLRTFFIFFIFAAVFSGVEGHYRCNVFAETSETVDAEPPPREEIQKRLDGILRRREVIRDRVDGIELVGDQETGHIEYFGVRLEQLDDLTIRSLFLFTLKQAREHQIENIERMQAQIRQTENIHRINQQIGRDQGRVHTPPPVVHTPPRVHTAPRVPSDPPRTPSPQTSSQRR